LGYGCHLHPVLRGYLERAAERIELEPEKSGLVITSGGRTAHTSAPGVSEAQVMADHLQQLGVTRPILVEDAARTTAENLRTTSRLIAEKSLRPRRVIIFCDRVRRHKIGALARHFLREHAFTLEPHDLARTLSQAIVQSTVAVPFDSLVARVPLIERL